MKKNYYCHCVLCGDECENGSDVRPEHQSILDNYNEQEVYTYGSTKQLLKQYVALDKFVEENELFDFEFDKEEGVIPCLCGDCATIFFSKEDCIEYGEKDKYKIRLNGFLYDIYSESEIEEILLNDFNKLSEERQRYFIKEYIKQDSSWFVKEYKKDVYEAFEDIWLGEDAL